MAHYIQLDKPQEPYSLQDPAVRYIKILFGSDKTSAFVAQARAFSDKIYEEYQKDPASVPTIDASEYRTISAKNENIQECISPLIASHCIVFGKGFLWGRENRQ